MIGTINRFGMRYKANDQDMVKRDKASNKTAKQHIASMIVI